MQQPRHLSFCILHPAFCIALVLAALCTASASAAWLYDGSGSTKTLTETDPPDGGPAWVLKCTVSGSDLTVSGVQTAGTNAVLDLSASVADANATPYAIVAIGNSAFKQNGTIEEVRLPNTLATIGMESFNNCPLLTKVTPLLPDSVSSVGYNAFRATPVTGSLRVGFEGPFAFARGQYGGQYQQFYGSCIEEFIAGPGLTEIPQETFSGCTSLTNVDLSATTALTTIGLGAFTDCTALSNVTPFLPDTVTEVGVQAFRNDPIEGTLRIGFGGPFTLLADSRGWNGSEYFRNTKIGEVVFGPGVTNIKRMFAADCTALTNIVFQTTNLTTIGFWAFDNCTALRHVTPLLPDTLTTLGVRAFRNAPVEGTLRLGFGGPFTLGNDENNWNQGSYFTGAKIGEIVFGPGIDNIKKYFIDGDTALTNILFQTTNLVTIGEGAFYNCSALRRVDPLLPETLTYLAALSFNGTVVEGSLRLGFGGALTLGTEYYNTGRQFWGTKITEIVFDSGATSVPANFAYGCTSLTNVVFQGTNEVSVGNEAFASCSALRDVRARP